MADNLEFIFDLSNKMSPQIEKIMSEVQLLAKSTDAFKNVKIKFNDTGVDKFHNKLKATRGTMQYYREALQRLEQGRDRVWRTDQIERYNRMITKVKDNIAKINTLYGNKGGTVTPKQGLFSGQMGEMLQWGLGIGTAMKVFDYAKSAALTGARYEKYQAVLENALGSREGARFRMDELKNLSSQTPFQIKDWVEGDIKLQNRGQNLNTGQLTNLGDLAASQGKGIDQLVEAMLDAQQMEFERLKEFGIKANKEGDKVTLNFKNQAVTVKANSDAISQAIIQMGTYRGVAGGMAKISKTTEGAISNLGDSVEQMMAAIGQAEAGPVKDLISGLSSVTNTVKKWVEVPTAKKLQEEKGEMNALVAVVEDYTKTSEQRNLALQQLQSAYPEYFANLTEEDVRLGKLRETLDKINVSYEKKIKLANAKDLRQSNMDDLNAAKNEQLRLENMLFYYNQARKGDESAVAALEKTATFWERANLIKSGSSLFADGSEYETYLKDKLGEVTKQINQGELLETKNAQREKLAMLDTYLEQYQGKYDELSKKINEKDLEKFRALYDEFFVSQGKRSKGDIRWIDKQFAAGQAIESLLTGKPIPGAGGISGGGSAMGGKSDAIIGGGAKPVNITVNINEFKGIDKLTTNNSIRETTPEIENAVMDALLRAINGAVMMTGNNIR